MGADGNVQGSKHVFQFGADVVFIKWVRCALCSSIVTRLRDKTVVYKCSYNASKVWGS